MALRDFKEYLNIIQNQVLEMKADLKDFDQALKDNYITEDKLEEVKKETELIETNYQRLLYVAYLLNLPQRKSKHTKYRAANADFENYFNMHNADKNSVVDENKNALDSLRCELKALKKKDDR